MSLNLAYYRKNGRNYASFDPSLPLDRADHPPDTDVTWLFRRLPRSGRTALCISDARQLSAETEDIRFLDPSRISDTEMHLPHSLLRQIDAHTLTAVNCTHPRWETALNRAGSVPGKKRVHLLAVGDVGGTLLMGLKLLGGDAISSIGICDLNPNTMARWTAEMGQVSWPWAYDTLPEVEAVEPHHLFDCDVFIFAATRGIPAVGSAVTDVRMAQFAANRPLVEQYARQARAAQFAGQFIVLSDPVDPLCRAAFLASNAAPGGEWDGQGLFAEQIRGFGLGVMNARAADLARRDRRFSAFLSEGRSFGPHGEGLVIANSVSHYDDTLSQELTDLVKTANLRIRDLGFKPYVAPALSSGAMQLLLMLREQWHCGSVCLGDVWFGCRSRRTAAGLEAEILPLPDALFDRLAQTQAALSAIL